MQNPILIKDLPFRSKFYTGMDGNVYTRLRPTEHLPDNKAWAINEEFELFCFELEKIIYHTY